MPYFSIETNQVPDDAGSTAFTRKASAFVAELLGKPESYVMTSLEPKTAMTFGATNGPAAFVRLKSIGLPRQRCGELAEAICAFVDRELGVPKDRVFIDFKDVERSLFGWNGDTF
jgi:phenylpyruvate tautomerase PptA (4-oxalocrotonate tautomerase family)